MNVNLANLRHSDAEVSRDTLFFRGVAYARKTVVS